MGRMSPSTPADKAKSRIPGLPGWLHASDIHGLAQLATQATLGVAGLTENVHGNVYKTVASFFGPLGARFVDRTVGGSGVRSAGVTGLVYGGVRGVARLAGGTVNALLSSVVPLVAEKASSRSREAMLATLNGVLGDQLQASGNPLAIRMSLRHEGQPLTLEPAALAQRLPGASARLLVLIHGLCMNDLQWHTPPGSDGAPAVDLGLDLSKTLGYTPIYVRYNTGLHTSENGALLSQQLEHLAQHWPPGLVELRVLAHSMGGLVTRSAFHHAQTHDLQWQHKLKAIVFLGTPHHGAPLERAGNWVDVVLGSTPFSRPFARLGHLRSAGITDLRYGHVLATDWEGHDRFRRQPDRRTPCPLPPHVDCFTVAATAARQRSPLSERLLGDGLVPLDSALGHHPDPALQLPFAKNRQYIVYGTHHMQLLSDAAIGAQILHWLRPSGLQLRP